MSWADKAFHSVLTNKTSRQVWVAAFGNIPETQRLPPCPEDLTEIAYANLLFNPRCMVCLVFVSDLTELIRKSRTAVRHMVQRIGQLV